MNSLAWQAGKNLKRSIEATGRRPTLNNYAVAIVLLAREEGTTLEEIVHALIQANEYDAATSTLDKDARMRELGF